MDMDFTMSAALWGAALATAVSFTTAIGVTAAARARRFAKSAEGSSENRGAMEAPVANETFLGDIVPLPYPEDTEENHWESIRAEPLSASREPAGSNDDSDKNTDYERAGLPASRADTGAAGPGFDKAESERYKEEGRRHIHQWDIAFSEGEWEWDLLEQATRCYLKAIRCDPENQHAWLNLAFTYHLSGDKKKATECLQKSNILAGPGPYGSSRDYRQVTTAVQNDTTLFGQRLHRPPVPAGFRDGHERFPEYFDYR